MAAVALVAFVRDPRGGALAGRAPAAVRHLPACACGIPCDRCVRVSVPEKKDAKAVKPGSVCRTGARPHARVETRRLLARPGSLASRDPTSLRARPGCKGCHGASGGIRFVSLDRTWRTWRTCTVGRRPLPPRAA
eukprot:6436279-Prymnesium_polylepis.2